MTKWQVVRFGNSDAEQDLEKKTLRMKLKKHRKVQHTRGKGSRRERKKRNTENARNAHAKNEGGGRGGSQEGRHGRTTRKDDMEGLGVARATLEMSSYRKIGERET